MIWKIISVVCAVVSSAAVFVGWQNHQLLAQKQSQLKNEQITLQARTDQLTKVEQQIETQKKGIETLALDIETLVTEQVDVDNEIVVAEAEWQVVKHDRSQLQQQVEKNREVDFLEIAAVQKRIAESHSEIETLEVETVKVERQYADLAIRHSELQTTKTNLIELKEAQDQGYITGGFQSQIIEAYQRWGFVVIDGGSQKGVVPFAQFEVLRDGALIARLLVTQVESDRCVADIIPGSQRPGTSLKPGDTITQSPR